MDTDPLTWSVADVQKFFREEAPQFVASRTKCQLPPAETFLQSLDDCGVDGEALLQNLTPDDLKTDFDIKSFSARNAVLYCINKLRIQSANFTRPVQPPPQRNTQPHTPADTPKLPVLNATAPVPTPEQISENLRDGEVEVFDDRGKKRRKLNLVPAEAPKPAHKQERPSGYLSKEGLPLDGLFYGKRGFGEEVGLLPPEGEIWIKENDDDSDQDDFSFVEQHKTPGQSGYVYRQIQHFLSNAEVIHPDPTNNDNFSLAVLPYREGVNCNAEQSASVFISSGGEEVSVVRRQASALNGDQDEHAALNEPGSSEWDFLLHAYKHTSSDPTIGDDDDRSQTEGLEEDDRGDSESGSMCEVEDVESGLEEYKVIELTEKAVSDCISSWKENTLPKREAAQAWTVWKKMKQSKSLRDDLISNSQSLITHFKQRLGKLQEGFIKESWPNEQDLLKACVAMEPTVQDIEEQKWKISVWQRTKEPEHVSRPSVRQTQLVHGSQPAITAEPAFVVPSDDRLSVSPTPATRIETGTQPAAEDDQNQDLPVGSMPSEGDVDMPDATDELPFIDSDKNIVVARRQSTEVEAAPATSSTKSPKRPSPSTLVKLRVKVAPVKSTSQLFSAESSPTIDLTGNAETDPEYTPPEKRKSIAPAVRPVSFNGPPEESTWEEVDSWQFKDLLVANDRDRILIKMLRGADPKDREAAFLCLTNMGTKDFVSQLRAGAAALRPKEVLVGVDSDQSVLVGVDGDHATIIMMCTRLLIAWFHCSHGILQRLDDKTIKWEKFTKKSPLDDQVETFTQKLRKYLLLRNSKLFVKQRGTSKTDPVQISDGESGYRKTPKKKRKNAIRESKTAIQSRQVALKRQEKYNQELAKSKYDPTKLIAMIPTDPSRSQIPINLLKEDDQEYIYIAPAFADKMKEHQIEGVRFMWREITAPGDDAGHGCLLAHTMGLGKTMQTLAILVALVETSESQDRRVREQLPPHLRHSDKHLGNRRLRMMILCPPTLLKNWRTEIDMWTSGTLGKVFVLEASPASVEEEVEMLHQWSRIGGVLLIGFHKFRSMITREQPKGGNRENKYRPLGQKIDKYLLRSTDLVIADEAHNLKNQNTKLAMATARIRTETRIALTGTPISNDVLEIYALVSWVAPGYLGDLPEFKANYAEPIQEGTYEDSFAWEVRRSIKKLKVFHHQIMPKVNRANITALKGSIKAKVEFVITVPLTEIQTVLYKRYVDALMGGGENAEAGQMRIFSWLAVLTLLTNHPRAFQQKLLTRQQNKRARSTLDDEESGTSTPLSTANAQDSSEITILADGSEELPGDQDVFALGFNEEMVQSILHGLGDNIDPLLSAKSSILLDILRLSGECGDSVLVFSSSIPTLNYLSDLLKSRSIRLGRIDGKVSMEPRMKLLDDFANRKFEVMLVSTRAGGVGLNMQRANRVVVFDFGFNPTVEEQAIGRAYRLGQEKPVFVYRFIAGGTFETNLYNKQLFKASLAQRVVDKKNPRRSAQRNEAKDYLYEPRPVAQESLSEWVGKDPSVLDRILDERSVNYQDSRAKIRAIKTMETLQEEVVDSELTEEEKKEVDMEIQEGLGRLQVRKLQAVAGTGPSTLTRYDPYPGYPSHPIPSSQSSMSSQPGPSTQPAYSMYPQSSQLGPSTQPAYSVYPQRFIPTQPGSSSHYSANRSHIHPTPSASQPARSRSGPLWEIVREGDPPAGFTSGASTPDPLQTDPRQTDVRQTDPRQSDPRQTDARHTTPNWNFSALGGLPRNTPGSWPSS